MSYENVQKNVLGIHDKQVTFNLDKNEVYILPIEDRKSPWMTIAGDRYRFQRRIREVEKVLEPVFTKTCILDLCMELMYVMY